MQIIVTDQAGNKNKHGWIFEVQEREELTGLHLTLTHHFCCTVACTGLSRCIHKGSVRGHFERCFYFHWSVWTSPLISFRYIKMDRKPKKILCWKRMTIQWCSTSQVTFLLTCVIIRDLSIAANWNLALRCRYWNNHHHHLAAPNTLNHRQNAHLGVIGVGNIDWQHAWRSEHT